MGRDAGIYGAGTDFRDARRAWTGADIHALGAILYELLTGRPPFQGESPIETLVQVRNQEAVPLRRLNPRIPRDMETIDLKCLEKSPSRTLSSAAALAADLRRFLEGRPIYAAPRLPDRHAWRWCQPSPGGRGARGHPGDDVLGRVPLIVLLWRHAEVESHCAEQEGIMPNAGYRSARNALAEALDLGEGDFRPGVVKGPGYRAPQTRRPILDVPSHGPGIEISNLAYVDLVLGREFDLHGSLVELVRFTPSPCRTGKRFSKRTPLIGSRQTADWRLPSVLQESLNKPEMPTRACDIGSGPSFSARQVAHRVRGRVGNVGGMPRFPREACRSPGRP